MDLNWLLTTGSLLVLVYAAWTWAQERRGAGAPAAPGGTASVNNSRPKRPRLGVRNVRRPVERPNPPEPQQEAAEPPPEVRNVPPPIDSRSAPATTRAADLPALPSDRKELTQLAAALHARALGKPIDVAIQEGFGLKKGGGPAYKRARALFDEATKPP